MTIRLRQWLVFFFTRPIRLSDLSSLASRMTPRAKVVPLPEATSAEPIELKLAPPAPARKRQAPRADVVPSAVLSVFRPVLEIGVSEQPIDTLPAELRDELRRPSSGHLGSGLRDH